MEIEFELTLEDLLAFNRYHTRQSPAIRGQLLRGRLAFPIVFAIVWLVLCQSGSQVARVISGVLFAVTGAIIFLSYPTLLRRRTRRLVERMYMEGQNRSVFARRRLTTTPETITEATAVSVTTHKWIVVEKIVTDRHHAYFYVTAVSAFVLPKAAFATEAEFHTFVETAKRYQREAPV